MPLQCLGQTVAQNLQQPCQHIHNFSHKHFYQTLVFTEPNTFHSSKIKETLKSFKIAANSRLLKHQNLRYADDITLMAESEEELKSLLMTVKVESENVGIKLNIQKTKIMASGPITSWQIDGERVEKQCQTLFWGAPKSLQMVTAAMKLKDAYSLEGKL